MKKPLKILLLEDKPSDAKLIQLELRKTNKEFESRVVQDKKNFLKEIEAFQPDLILSDYSMPQFTGLDALDIVKKKCPEIPFIIVTDSLNEETAVKCIRWGAWDYVIKDTLIHLGHAVKNAIKLKAEKERIKQGKEVLQESEEKFRAISESAIDSIFIKDVNFKYIHVNPAMEKLFGLTASNLIGKTDFELFGEETGKHFIETDKKVLKGKIIIDEYEKTVGGELYSFHTIKVPLKNSEGKIIGLCGIARDITEKKQAEELLHESEQKFRDMANLLPQIVYEIDIYGNLTFVNKHAFDNFGYSQEEYEKGFNVMQTLIPEDRDRAKENMQNILYGKDVGNPEYTALRKEGSTFPILIYSSAIFKDNKPIGLRGIIIDITERKKAEEALQESEKRFKHLVKNSNDVIVIIDENGKETYVSDSVERITGFSPVEVLNHSGFEFLHPDDVDHMSKTLSKLLKTPGGTIQDEYRHKRKDGGWVYLEAIGANYLHEPSIKGIVLNVRDITDRKQAEEALNKHFQQQKLLTEISYLFTKLGKFDENMKEAIRLIGEYSGVSRVYVFEDFNNGEFTKNSYEWCNKNIEPQINNLQEVPYKMIPSWKKFLIEKGMVLSSNILELPQDLIDILEPQKIKSIFVLPIYVKDRFFGFMGFDECEKHRIWDKSKIELLKTVTNIISTLFERKQAEEDIKKRNEELEIFNRMAVGREMKMIELKKEINNLLEKAGEKPAYEIVE